MIFKSLYCAIFPIRCPWCRSSNVHLIGADFSEFTWYHCRKCSRKFIIWKKRKKPCGCKRVKLEASTFDGGILYRCQKCSKPFVIKEKS